MDEKQENPIANLIFNAAIPSIVLIVFSKEKYLGPIYGLIVAFVFPISSSIYGLIMLVSEPGTSAFTEELGKMTAYSFPVIALPSIVIILFIFYLIVKSITKLTGLRFDEIFAKR